jgi:hypothetical protein
MILIIIFLHFVRMSARLTVLRRSVLQIGHIFHLRRCLPLRSVNHGPGCVDGTNGAAIGKDAGDLGRPVRIRSGLAGD